MDHLKISPETQEEIAVYRNLQKYGAWKRVVAFLETKVAEADKIVNQVGADRRREYTQRDIAIVTKNAYQLLIDFPQVMIDHLSGTGEDRMEEFDPWLDEGDDEEGGGNVAMPDSLSD